MVIYYIYEIPGVKVGCTVDLHRRGHILGEDSRYTDARVLEEIERECDDEESRQLAGDREIWWQLHLDYGRDNKHYKLSRDVLAAASSSGGQSLHANGLGLWSQTEEQWARVYRNGGIAAGRANVEQQRGAFALGECPYCGKRSNMGNLLRWHFDNCKKKPS